MKDKPENHDWIPQYMFEYTNHDKPVMCVLYCSICGKIRYQYGDKLI